MSNIYYYDIESAPLPEDKIIFPEFKADSRIKDPAKIEADIAKKKAAFIDKAALSPNTGQILAIGYQYGQDVTINEKGKSEAEMLEDFWIRFTDATCKLACWNASGFDLPFIWGRCMILGVKVPIQARNGRYWGDRLIDLMEVYCGYQYKAMYSLDNACKQIGVDVRIEKEIEGKDFYKYWNGSKEEHEKARDYLKSDLKQTQAIGEHMNMSYPL